MTWYDGPLFATKALFLANAIHQEHMKLDLLLVIFSFPLSLPIATLLLFLLPNFSKENLIFDNKHSNDNLKHKKTYNTSKISTNSSKEFSYVESKEG